MHISCNISMCNLAFAYSTLNRSHTQSACKVTWRVNMRRSIPLEKDKCLEIVTVTFLHHICNDQVPWCVLNCPHADMPCLQQMLLGIDVNNNKGIELLLEFYLA